MKRSRLANRVNVKSSCSSVLSFRDCAKHWSRNDRRTDARHRPYFLRGPGEACLLFSCPRKEGDGAPSGAAFLKYVCGFPHTAPFGAPSRLSLQPLKTATQLQVRASWDAALAAVSRLRPIPVQRAPRRAVVMPPGRSPGAARERGYEPRPQAPHQPGPLAPARPWKEDGVSPPPQPSRCSIVRTSRDDAPRRARRGSYESALWRNYD